MPNYCFFVLSVHLPVEFGYGCSLSVASNGFAIANRTFTCRNKNNAPHECGNPRCQGDRVRLAIGRTIPSPSLTSADCFACKQEGKARSRWASAAFGRTAPSGLRRAPRGSIVKAAALYTLGLAPGFNIDSRSRQAQFYQSPNSQESNFRALTVFVTDH
jgi:hypothetical protein